ncbi:MAG: hypothetical protein J5I93_23180 [Pirellulaceae bacterium]|nr:hypothetical protein [Pirellulaceae bacterium]
MRRLTIGCLLACWSLLALPGTWNPAVAQSAANAQPTSLPSLVELPAAGSVATTGYFAPAAVSNTVGPRSLPVGPLPVHNGWPAGYAVAPAGASVRPATGWSSGGVRVAPLTTARPVTATTSVPPAGRPVRPVYVGKGLIGQPKLYVEGQPLRNALRFLTP